MSQEFAHWLKHQLDRREWTQADFARRVDSSTGLVSMWLAGKRTPGTESCQKIADVLNVDPDDVLTRAGHRPATEPLRPDDPAVEVIELVKRLRGDPDFLAALRPMLEARVQTLKERRKDGGG